MEVKQGPILLLLQQEQQQEPQNIDITQIKGMERKFSVKRT